MAAPAGAFTPTPAVSHAILGLEPGPHRGTWPTASSSPPRTTRPTTAASSTTRPTAVPPTPTSPTGWPGRPTRCSRPATARSGACPYARALRGRLRPHLRLRHPVRGGPGPGHRPGRHPRLGPAPGRRRPGRRRPGLLGAHRPALRPADRGAQRPLRPHLRLHVRGQGRQDPHGLLLAPGHGRPGGAQGPATTSPSATTPTSTATASSAPAPA